jgi:hypothetical protein
MTYNISVRVCLSSNQRIDPSCFSTKSSLLILDRHLAPRNSLVLIPNEVADLLILGLLDCTFIILGSLLEEFLLGEVDACVGRCQICFANGFI